MIRRTAHSFIVRLTAVPDPSTHRLRSDDPRRFSLVRRHSDRQRRSGQSPPRRCYI